MRGGEVTWCLLYVAIVENLVVVVTSYGDFNGLFGQLPVRTTI